MSRVTGDWLTRDETQGVLRMLTDAGHQAFVVGGCVRNALIGQPVSDIDIATDALPETVSILAERAGFAAIPTGIEHGTVTVVTNDIPHEITTFRADVETDGRRAVVAFTRRLEEDARRRDFTMNALYADAAGAVTDPLGGVADALSGHVVFIEDAEARIREDYLRILRFFRFYAWYGHPEEGADAEALAAIAANADGLDKVSAERIGAELTKLLDAPDPAPAVAAMQATGVLAHVLPGADATALPVLVHLEDAASARPAPVRRLACLWDGDAARLRWSKADQKRHRLLRDLMSAGMGIEEMAYRHGADAAVSTLILLNAGLGTDFDPEARERARRGASAVFPLKAADLMPRFEGKALGNALTRAEARWIGSGFSLTREELLAEF